MTTTAPSDSDAPAPARTAGRASSDAPNHGDRALSWWKQFCHPVTGDPATRARLRRARSSLDALQVNAAASLARRLGAIPRGGAAPDWRVRAALDLARVLAHVKEHDATRHPMKAAGWKSFPSDPKKVVEGDRPVLSEQRFKRLMVTGDGEEKVTAFTRLVVLLGGQVNIADLSKDFLFWNHPEIGDRVRERWAFHYLAAGDAAPPAPSTDNEGDDA